MKSENNEKRLWLDKQRNLFNFMFWSIEALIIVMLLLFWDTLASLLGIADSPLAEIISFLFIAGILTTINEYIHSRKGSELEMYYNIDKIRECIEKNTEYQYHILDVLQKIEQNKYSNGNTTTQLKPKNEAKPVNKVIQNTQRIKPEDVPRSSGCGSRDERVNNENIPDLNKTLPKIEETALQDIKYEIHTKFPLDFDPIDYLRKENADSDILETYAARRAIRRWYKECSEYITEYADYSVVRTERRQETVKVEDHRIKINIEISSEDGISYHIKITFTPEE